MCDNNSGQANVISAAQYQHVFTTIPTSLLASCQLLYPLCVLTTRSNMIKTQQGKKIAATWAASSSFPSPTFGRHDK
jgi:hypothetical protein